MNDIVRRILVVEAEPDLREIIVSLLRENCADVDEAENGEEGLAKLLAGNYTLVVSDIHMPKMSGLQLLERAKQEKITIPFVIITAFGDQDNLVKALRLGVFDFIRKPFDDEEVHSVVSRALEVGHRLRQIASALDEDTSDLSNKIRADENFIRLLALSNYRKRA